MTELEPVRHINQTIPVLKIVHIRQSIFVVSYINGLIEMIDFSTPSEPLVSFQIPNDDNPKLATLVDIDVI